MGKKILHWELSSLVFIIIMGFVFHFAFFWFNNWKPLALFFAVNESVWEHCKLGFWPALIFAVIEYFFWGYRIKNFFVSKAVMLLTIPSVIIVIFYTYTGIIGFNTLIIDISLFFVASITAQYLSYRILTGKTLPSFVFGVSAFIIVLLVIAFSAFTFNPVYIPLFQEAKTGIYGIPPG